MKILRRPITHETTILDGVPDILKRIYLARGVESNSDVNLILSELCSPTSMKGIDEATSLLAEAIKRDWRILIVGDFDCDGATSTALSVLALRRMGAKFVDYIVPNRFEFGYGLTPEIVDYAHSSKSPDLIITVDNGIASIEGVERAKAHGMKVLITDHHLPGDEHPQADAVVNPNQSGCEFPSKAAAGVAVIFYVLTCLRTVLRESAWFEERGIAPLNMSVYLDLVALGTVADLVPLDKNNRILVAQGIQRIRSGSCRPGIKALMMVAGKKFESVKSSDMGFILGPRLNAAGRLDDMSIGIECLLAETDPEAIALATRLDQLNVQRKQIEAEMKLDAEENIKVLLSEVGEGSGSIPWWGMSLYEPHWHQGVIGILASRVKEKLHRPVIAFAPETDDSECISLKGSARSIPGLHMRDALDMVSKRYPDLIHKFGGHAMAAGLTLSLSKFDEFRKAFDETVRELINEADLEEVLFTDGELDEKNCNLNQIELLGEAGPWGQKFPEPSFDNVFRVVNSKVLKERHLKLVLQFDGGIELYDAIQFNSEWVDRVLPEKIRVVYRPDINEFRGRRSVQFMIDHIGV